MMPMPTGGGMNMNMMNMDPNMMAQMKDPAFVSEMMNSPMMSLMMDNPEIMRDMMMSQPGIQEMLQNNPEMRQILNDPEMIRMSLQAARNPSMMQEMMRHNDLAMSQLENIPEGFSLLRQHYQNVEAPLREAMNASPSGTGNGTGPTGDAARSTNAPASAPLNLGGAPAASAASSVPSPWMMHNPLTQDIPFPSGIPAAATTTAAAAPHIPPEQRYTVQLQQLADMGFTDRPQCIRALERCGGNVNQAVEILLSGM